MASIIGTWRGVYMACVAGSWRGLYNQALHHEDVLGKGGTIPHILNLSTRWMEVVSFMP